LQSKVNNPNFTNKAPAKVVEKERQKLTEQNLVLADLMNQLKSLK